MTPEQGYEMAKFQRPGVKIVMGPTDAVEVEVTPISFLELHDMPGDPSWFDRDMRAWLGFVPSLWATFFATVAGALGHVVTKDEWEWLDGRNSSLDKARKWINDIAESKKKGDTTMTERKWTPGPWKVDSAETLKVRNNYGSIAMIMQTHLTGRRSYNETTSNARLIAAAPDLYEALEEVLDGLGFLSGGDHELEGLGISEAGDPQDQVDRLIDEDRRMIRRAILALITDTDEGASDE